MVVETRPEQEVIDARQAPTVVAPKEWHPLTLAIVFAEGDLALVAEINNMSPEEVTRHAIIHAEDITSLMYDAFKGRLIKEMSGRLGGLSDGNLLKLFDLVKGNPGFSVEVAEGAGGGDASPPRFTIKMGVQRATDD